MPLKISQYCIFLLTFYVHKKHKNNIFVFIDSFCVCGDN